MRSDQSTEPMLTSDNRKGFVLHTRVVSGTGGGPEKTILNSPRYLKPYGWESLCAYLYPPDDPGFEVIRTRAEQLNCPLAGIPDRGITDLSVVARFRKLCREKNVSIWHGHDYKSNAIGWLLNRLGGLRKMKLVTTVHGWVFQTARTPYYYAVDRYCIKRYDAVICVSSDLYDTCLEFGVRKDRLFLIENAIDTNDFRPREANDSSSCTDIDNSVLRIGAVGRLAPEKGFADLIETVADLMDTYPQLQLSIYGDGPQRSELQTIIDRLNAEKHLADRIRLEGFAADLHALYSSLDIFVLNSVREGLPNVCLEAMATGVPMISTAVAGVPRLVDSGVNGLIIPIGDTCALRSALVRLIESPELRTRLACQARKTIVEKFSFDKRMEKIRAVYDDLTQ